MRRINKRGASATIRVQRTECAHSIVVNRTEGFLDDSLQQSAQTTHDLTTSARSKRLLRRVFVGNHGIRWPWRIALFIATFLGVAFGMAKLLHYVFGPIPNSESLLTLLPFYLGECVQIVSLMVALAVVSAIERRPMLSFGLQGSAGWSRFAGGLICGFVAISVTVFALMQMHVLTLDAPTAHGATAWLGALAWGGVFLLVAIFEESALRGYLQYTLTQGIGFWWSAILLSVLFGGLHGSNPGETPVGLISAGAFGIVFCLSLWYTGSLFWAIGFHAAWDWGESYFYGTSDSGTLVDHRFFTAHPFGNVLLSGGKTGPEGSVLALVLLAVVAVLMRLWWGRRTTSPFSGNGWKPARQQPLTNS
jgi:membrane protease YdiL (CAAX protease family)